ncbi:MAG TPA: hypothetical protein VK932_12200 [Kofleriaceae bacterium]|nr:hypothetical protein [Kofleriaceae bacterium]
MRASRERLRGPHAGGGGARAPMAPRRKGLTIQVTDVERAEWERAAKETEKGLSDWVRDTCNEAAAQRSRGKSKP